MFIDGYGLIFREAMGSLLLATGAVVAVGLFRWAGLRYARICRQHGAALAACGLTGQLAAQRLLALAHLGRVKVVRSRRLNAYDPWRRQIQLNAMTHDSPNLLAITTAAHEVGHAQQFAAGTLASRLRLILWPACWIFVLAAMALPLLQIAEIVSLPAGTLCVIMLALGFAVVGLQLPVHLSLEHDASHRARRLAQEARLIGPAEQQGFDAMLRSAWHTHAAQQAQGYICLLTAAIMVLATPGLFATGENAEMSMAPAVVPQPPAPPDPMIVQRIERRRQMEIPPAPAPPDDLFGATYFAWSALFGLGPCIVFYLLVTRLQGGWRRRHSAAILAIQRNNEGQGFYQEGRYPAALLAFDEALRLNPTLAAAYFNRGTTNSLCGRLDAALADFDACLLLTPNNFYAIAARGAVWAKRGDLDRCHTEYDAALKLAPENAFLLLQRGKIWLARDQYDRAIADLAAALERDRHLSEAWRDRGLAWYFKDQPAPAISDLDEAIRLNPTDAVAFNNRGAAQLKAGNYSQAEADLRRALELDPNFPNPHKHLARLAELRTSISP